MRMLVIAVVILAAIATASSNYVSMFEKFKKDHSRQYASAAEETKRFGYFVQNMKKAAALAKANPLASFGANEFADISAAEFKSYHNAEHYYTAVKKAQLETIRYSAAEKKATAGQAIDWRTKGAVTGVKNQGQCGSCWAFSATGSIEGQWFLAGNTLTSVSEQELVSCDTTDSGCDGGLPQRGFAWLISAHQGQIVTEASYGYVSGGGNVPACSMSGTVVGATIDSYKMIATNEDDMATFVYASGPLSIGVYAEPWQTYTSGIMTDCPASQDDHGVLIVGFDENNSPPYWIVKNSWGASWGESGYIRLEKGTNQCNIKSSPSTAICSKGPGPSPPGPTPPTPPSGDFDEKVCSDDKCKNCTSHKQPLDKCIHDETKAGRGSFSATCDEKARGLLVKEYKSINCTGSYTQGLNPTGKCTVAFNKHRIEWIETTCGSSPGPTPPTPPTPTPAPSGGTVVQMNCQDAACSQGCQNSSFPLDTCEPLNGGGSAIATCNAQGLLLTAYEQSTTCTGPSTPDQMPVDQCLQSEGGYFENFCFPGGQSKATPKLLRQLKKW